MANPRKPSPPGEGERRAQRGYVPQYDSSAAAIYASLERDDLIWVGLADRQAGVADDLVLGLRDRIVGHQFKASKYPEAFRLRTFFLGADGLLQPLASAWQVLTQSFPACRAEIRVVTNNYPSTSDSLVEVSESHSAAFLRELEQCPNRTLAEWKLSRWWPFISELAISSGLDQRAFESFLGGLRILSGARADFLQVDRLSPSVARHVRQIASLLPRLIADIRDRDRWTREQFLEELGWRDSFALRRSHRFPIGVHVQRNALTEQELKTKLRNVESGYLALMGSPGSGKSTLLQSSVASEPNLVVIRYLAFVPGEGQGIGRAEADDFLDDLNAQLKRSGLRGLRYHDSNLQERREQFDKLIQQAARRFEEGQVKTLIIVDGLDHIPREEKPERSLLKELPLPGSLPAGVVFLLGTQRVDLIDLPPAVQEQASLPQRQIFVAPLSRTVVYRIADVLGLDPEVPRQAVFELSRGHPLVTRYLVEELRGADPAGRAALLGGEFTFEGDLEAVYSSAWRGIQGDSDARDVMGYLARAEGSIEPELLARATSTQAVERALASTRHLLRRGSQGWSVFHNSFRLFLLGKPRLRFGEPDPKYSSEMYKRLAGLAREASAESPQRWLELRYLARAQQYPELLALAQPARFRLQLADGRPAAEIQADIRLSFEAAKSSSDATTVFRLLLARDEVGRRADTLASTPAVVDALLAAGEIDEAIAFAEANNTGSYQVVDALLEMGDVDRARELFERTEPIGRVTGGESYDPNVQDEDLREWAERVFQFRDAEQINEAMELVSSSSRFESARSAIGGDSSRESYLRLEVARAVVRARPDSDPATVARQLKVEERYLPYILLEAASKSREQGDTARALTLLLGAVAHTNFPEIQNGWRRVAAMLAVEFGKVAIARDIFSGLKVPTIALLDDRVGNDEPEGITRAVMEHAQLATALDEPIVEVQTSKRRLLEPLQRYASTIGVLLGRLRAGASVSNGEVARVARQVLAYVGRASPEGPDEYYAVQQLAGALPVLSRAMLHAAALLGAGEYGNVIAEFDSAFAQSDSKLAKRFDLRRDIAREIYRWDGDTVGACERLDPIILELQESTPQTQIQELAELAETYVRVGNEVRAKELLRRIHGESLGYALAPKKDPQYVLWRELLKRANAVDTARRAERVKVMMRQLSGMTNTEGRSAAYRIASTVLNEAALVDCATGLSAARAMADWGVLSWDEIVSSLLAGMVVRHPETASMAAIAWASLALPYYVHDFLRLDPPGFPG